MGLGTGQGARNVHIMYPYLLELHALGMANIEFQYIIEPTILQYIIKPYHPYKTMINTSYCTARALYGIYCMRGRLRGQCSTRLWPEHCMGFIA